MEKEKKEHRRVSSHWTLPSPPLKEYLQFNRTAPSGLRAITSNIQHDIPRYSLENYISYGRNEISTTKYNALTFLPKNLFEQMHRMANVYFVFICVLNFCPIFRALDPIVSTIPVLSVLVITGIKDAVEDLRRRRLDNSLNSRTSLVWDASCNLFRKMDWKHVLVGDIIHISNNEILPADILLLRTSYEDGDAFLETSTLDGESNLKHRLLPKSLVSFPHQEPGKSSPDLYNINLLYSPPSKDINAINGSFILQGKREVFDINNCLLRGCTLKNTTFVEGIVLYAGKDTKVMQNNSHARSKRSALEKKTNSFVLVCALTLVLLVLVTTTLRTFWLATYDDDYSQVEFGAREEQGILSTIGINVIYYQLIIPLSLYITIEFIKLGQAIRMEWDIKMYSEERDEPFISRSLSTAEELGQISYLLSDKTGTITCNNLRLRYCATDKNIICVKEGTNIDKNDNKMQLLLLNIIACNTVFVEYSNRQDVIEIGSFDKEEQVLSVGSSNFFDLSENDYDRKIAKFKTDMSKSYHLEGESADEVALVKGIETLGVQLVRRTSTAIHVRFDGEDKVFNILCILPFDSERKRMSVCIEDSDGDVLVLTKGADSSMIPPAEGEEENYEETEARERITQRVNELANQGLRTLVMGMYSMERKDFDQWYQTFILIEKSALDEESLKLWSDMAQQLENKTKVIGVTGVEDKLQDGVASSISLLRQAGIQVWMLTGDKKETAQGVATACHLFTSTPLQYCRHDNNSYSGKDVLVSSEDIEFICYEDTQFKRLKGCSSLLCYRLTPSQKQEVVNMVKRNGGRVASIGDGANDVPMLQAAHVGIGVSGSEGMQASMAADFVISHFSFISRLLLVHGHWNYYRTSSVLLYLIYKNTSCVSLSFFIQPLTGWSCEYPIDATYSAIYPVIFTSLQPLLFGILDEDQRENTLLTYPELYSQGRRGEIYNCNIFLLYMLDAIWQGFVCAAIATAILINSNYSVTYWGFQLATLLFFTNILHLIMETRAWSRSVILIQLFCVFLHFGYFGLQSFVYIPKLGLGDNYGLIFSSFDLSFPCVCLLSSIIALTPRFIIKAVTRREPLTHLTRQVYRF